MRPFRLSVLFAAVLAFTAVGCGQATPGAASGSTGNAVGDQVRAYILEHPEVIEEAITKLQAKRQMAADNQIKQSLAQNREQMERDSRDFVAGNPQGAITVVEFFDYRCPYCKVAGPGIQKLLADNKDVRLVLKEFPILSPASEAAARAAIGAKAQGKYWPVHLALLAEKNLDDASIQRILQENGVDVARALRDGASAEADALIEETNRLARSTGVTGTPAFIIGDQMISGWVEEDIRAAIAAARKDQVGPVAQNKPA